MELIDELAHAYGDNNLTHDYFLDLETGEIIMELDEEFMDEPGIDWDVEENVTRYLEIPKTDSDEGYRLMANFAQQVENSEAGNRLVDALDRRRPFRGFKDAACEGLNEKYKSLEREQAVEIFRLTKKRTMILIKKTGTLTMGMNVRYNE